MLVALVALVLLWAQCLVINTNDFWDSSFMDSPRSEEDIGHSSNIPFLDLRHAEIWHA